MSEVKDAASRVDRLRVWFEGNTAWAFLIIVLLAAASIGFAFDESGNQGDRAKDAATSVLNSRQSELHTIAVVAHKSLLRSCLRGRSLRTTVRSNTLRERTQAQALYTFLGVAISRAKLTQVDTKVTESVRVAAGQAIGVYSRLQQQLDTDPEIPPKPPSCTDPRVVPTVGAFQTLANAASKKATSK